MKKVGIYKYYNQFVYYKKKHGYFGLFSKILSRLWWKINNKEILYYFDLKNEFNYNDFDLSLKSYSSINDLSLNDKMGILENNKNKEILDIFLRDLFNRGGTLWLANCEGNIVGLAWTFRRGFNGFYSLPLNADEFTAIAGETFPRYRGQNIMARMLKLICVKLREIGGSKIYVKVHFLNRPMLKSMGKTNAIKVGDVRTFDIFNRKITIWSKIY